METSINKRLAYCNDVIDKRKLQDLMAQAFHNYGVTKSLMISDKVKNLTFYYATRSGVSLNAEDLRVPSGKKWLLNLTNSEIRNMEINYKSGNISCSERFQKSIDTWNNTSNDLRDEVLSYFSKTDPLNPLYIMAFSGARGNVSQVRQLVGMRGLMSDAQGEVISLAIKSNFREGLTVTEYIISSYGARKGLIDTALRTADSGYLTRRLVDVAQDIIVRDDDCLTTDYLSYYDLSKRNKNTTSFKDRIIGRLLAQPLFSKDGQTLIAQRNTALTAPLIKKIENVNVEGVTVRSPLTCNSNRSVCRKCYGWHLAYSQIIDLGEAIGILAAQSIGEPGTQLTMRTFHTGGAFSGGSSNQIRAPFAGTIYFTLSPNVKYVRSKQGETSILLTKPLKVHIENFVGKRAYLKILEGHTLLVTNKQKIYQRQVLAEADSDSGLDLYDDVMNLFPESAGETLFQNLEIDENNLFKSSSYLVKKTGLIWVLYGEYFSFPKSASLEVSFGSNISKNNVLASHELINTTSGIVKFEKTSSGRLIKILNFSVTLKNSKITKNKNMSPKLTIINEGIEKNFDLMVGENELLTNGQAIAVLKDDTYKTQTGGIIVYGMKNSEVDGSTKKIFSGSLYWIPEETHVLDPDLFFDDLFVESDTFIKAGTELWLGNYSKLGGMVQFDEINNELIIKPGELFPVTDGKTNKTFDTSDFVKPGELIIDDVIAERLCYVEVIKVFNSLCLLVRPVQTFIIPLDNQGPLIENYFFSSRKGQSIKPKIIRRLSFKNRRHIKSNSSVHLLQTFIVLQIKTTNVDLQPQLELVRNADSLNHYKIKISFYEVLKPTSLIQKSEQTYILPISYLVKENQFISSNTIVAHTQILSKVSGTLVRIDDTNPILKKVLVVKENQIVKVPWKSDTECLKIKVGDLVRNDDFLTDKRRTTKPGQIYKITKTDILIRLASPYLINEGTTINVRSGDLIQSSDILATFTYQKFRATDIIQGLPKVEKILEARKIENGCLLAPSEGKAYSKRFGVDIINTDGTLTSVPYSRNEIVTFNNGDFVQVGTPLTEGPVSPHEMLDTLFNYYLKRLKIDEACKVSFKYLQIFLVDEVQSTYIDQGVHISDKHIEVIVKQMTHKVTIVEGGDTTLLPGEILSLSQAKKIEDAIRLADSIPPFYVPTLLGLTKASLNSDSFISAASFQETTRVLTAAAIEGREDWLYGLKENVIVGRLIPAGTGFGYHENLRRITKNILENESLSNVNLIEFKEDLLSSRTNE